MMPMLSAAPESPRNRAPIRRLVLIGFMGAGKSAVGPWVARALGWKFVDLDDEIARREGVPVPEVIRRRGIAHFRRVESKIGKQVLKRPYRVLSVGGGWAAQPGHMALLDGVALSVWLQVRPATALARIRASTLTRPLLEVKDPLPTARALLRERTPHYEGSRIRIGTEGKSPETVAREVIERAGPKVGLSLPESVAHDNKKGCEGST